MTVPIARRKFVVALAGAAAWPLAAHAQQGDRVRRIGVLIGGDENDPLAKARVSAFTQALAGLGWTSGGTTKVVYRVGSVGEQTAVSDKVRCDIDRRYVVSGRRRYDQRAMWARE